MGYSVRKLEGVGIEVITFRGKVSKEEVRAVFSHLSPVGSFTSPRRLWDLREGEFDLGPQDLEELGGLSRELDAEPAKVALLVDRDLTHGLARMYAVYRESANVEMQIFRDEDAALEWLS